MESLHKIFREYGAKSDQRFQSFVIDKNIGDLNKIQDESYLENSTWLGGDEEFVCLAIDLDRSSALSARKNPSTMAKIYEYFTKNIVDILNIDDIRADYIDIKGDGVFGIYQGEFAVRRAFVAAITFRTFFEKQIRPKFESSLQIKLNCKAAICKDKILVKRIGTRKYNNEVWAGRLVNNTYKLMKLSERIKEREMLRTGSVLVASSKIYDTLRTEHYNYALISCGCKSENGEKTHLWSSIDTTVDEDIYDDKAYYLFHVWCEVCGDKYISQILNA